jgi:hypothetical protein
VLSCPQAQVPSPDGLSTDNAEVVQRAAGGCRAEPHRHGGAAPPHRPGEATGVKSSLGDACEKVAAAAGENFRMLVEDGQTISKMYARSPVLHPARMARIRSQRHYGRHRCPCRSSPRRPYTLPVVASPITLDVVPILRPTSPHQLTL